MRILNTLALLITFLALPALAGGPPTHQCSKGGVVIAKKKKACVPAGGKWELIPGKPAPKPAMQ